ncbi:glycoside hydrolase family 88 protein [Niabella ginsengisoli]|uniref:Glycoside hydrolase family 88 protein n=1 Tax=Niabella ginsengisoli TaxID=522298 RepID=A0ABS9SNW5_9BACT|nr:glycoside hydrolase family 88 protein [Niabella ginsengisoli]MCH5599961.1 glycoside hydrolase family 88 protein [Niabella ginsengisoli]
MLVLCSFIIVQAQSEKDFVKENLAFCNTQLYGMLADKSLQTNKFPRTTNAKGELTSTSMYDWTPGFFPGSLWYGYEFSKYESLKDAAIKWTEKLEPLQTFTGHHDLGFMMYCSYGNAYRLTNNESYKNILIRSAKALSTRFNSKIGCIKSWNSFKSFHGDKTYNFPVIIDNMMNLEMLFFASKVSGDPTYRNVAVTHALTTMKNHFRPDYSSYHVVCYDSVSGKVETREAAQGYADNSTWARGQAWAIYGFTMTYRETKDPRFLKTAKGLAKYFINNKNLPSDYIPIWDFNAWQKGYIPGGNSNAPNIPVLYRDASAAAITASALLELSTCTTGDEAKQFKNAAVKMLHSLGSVAYRAKAGNNGNFILMHSVGSIPHNNEIDVPLVYADYYFIEALLRYEKLLDGKKLF